MPSRLCLKWFIHTSYDSSILRVHGRFLGHVQNCTYARDVALELPRAILRDREIIRMKSVHSRFREHMARKIRKHALPGDIACCHGPGIKALNCCVLTPHDSCQLERPHPVVGDGRTQHPSPSTMHTTSSLPTSAVLVIGSQSCTGFERLS